MSSCIFTKRKLFGILMIFGLLMAVCVAPVGAATKLIIKDNSNETTVDPSVPGAVSFMGGTLAYKADSSGKIDITISPPKDKAKDKAKK